MRNTEISERKSEQSSRFDNAYSNLAANSWRAGEMRALPLASANTDVLSLFGEITLVAEATSGERQSSDGYIKVYTLENGRMSASPDETKETAKVGDAQVKSEVVAPGSVITSDDNQVNWRKIQLERAAAQEPSATDMFRKPGEPKVAGEKFGIDGLGESEKLAQNVEDFGRPPTIILPIEIIETTTVVGAELAKNEFENWTSAHPLKGMEATLLQTATAQNPRAWEEAKAAFPQLANISPDLMKAYVLNELNNYDFFDHKQDVAAAMGIDKGWTLGMTQITTKGIREFEAAYPAFKKFLESKGLTGPGHELKALLRADCVAMIVAAKTATLVDDLKKHGIINPTNEQIAYRYNPDVYSYSDGHGGRVYKTLHTPQLEVEKLWHSDLRKEMYANKPEIIQASEHIRNVMALMPHH